MLARNYRQQVKKCVAAHHNNPKDTPQQRLQLLNNLLVCQVKCFFTMDLNLPITCFDAWSREQWDSLATIKKIQRKNRLKHLILLKAEIKQNLAKLNMGAVTKQDIKQLLLTLQRLRAETLQRNAIGKNLLVARLRIVDETYKRIVTNTSSISDKKYTQHSFEKITQTRYSINTESSQKLLVNKWEPSTSIQKNKIILLLSGLHLEANSYQSVSTALAQQGYLVIAPSLAGLTNKINTSSIDSITGDLKSIYTHLLTNYPNTEIIPMGHSLGAAILLSCHHIFRPQELKKMILLNPALNEFGLNNDNNALSLFRWLLSCHKRCFYKNVLPETKDLREKVTPSYPRIRDYVHCAYNTNKILTAGYKNFRNLTSHAKDFDIFIVQSKYDKIVNNIKIPSSNTQYKMIYGDHLQVIRDGEYFARLAQDFIEAA